MNIGILGCGVVGGILYDYLRPKHESVFRNDPKLEFNSDLTGVDVLFVCVNLPTEEDGTQDFYEMVELLKPYKQVKHIFIRTTVLPGSCDLLGTFLGTRVYALPEFLTMKTAVNDFYKLPLICGGGMDVLKKLFPDHVITEIKNSEAELTKYTHNSFGAYKVLYFNMIYKFCLTNGLDYNRVRESSQLTGFINDIWTHVPGPDGLRGYGNKCLPKDLHAFSKFLGGKEGEILERVHELNKEYRSDDQKFLFE